MITRIFPMLFCITLVMISLFPKHAVAQYNFEYGSRKVGFTSTSVVDSSRRFTNGTVRNIHVGIWYPASGDGVSFPVGQYAIAYDTGYHPNNFLNRNSHALKSLIQSFQSDSIPLHKLLAAAAKARYRASMEKGKHPLLLYAASFNGRITENFALAEYLASHGFVVACIPGWGSDSIRMKLDQESLQAQQNDLEMVLHFLNTQEYIDQEKVSIGGFSIGCIPAIRLALKQPQIKAVITLDGTHCYRFKMLNVDSSSNSLTLNRPYLQLNQRDLNRFKLDNTFFSLQKKGSIYLQFKALDHQDFSGFYLLLNSTVKENLYQTQQLRNYSSYISGGVKINDYITMNSIVLEFLLAYVTKSNATEKFVLKYDREQSDYLLTHQFK